MAHPLCEFGDKAHEIPSITNCFLVIGEYQMIPNHKELLRKNNKLTLVNYKAEKKKKETDEGMYHIKIWLFHKRDLTNSRTSKVMVCFTM